MTAKERQWPSLEQRKARMALSERFLDEIVIPAIQDASIVGAEELPQLIENFRQENSGLGDDFDIGHIWLHAWEQDIVNRRLLEKAPEKLPSNAADIAIAAHLLKEIAFPSKD